MIPSFRRMMAGECASCLRISEKGLEYRCWPFYELGCHWEDITGIQKSAWFGETLLVRCAEKLGFLEFCMVIGLMQIPLKSLEGWPQGGLELDLQCYAPQLIKSVR